MKVGMLIIIIIMAIIVIATIVVTKVGRSAIFYTSDEIVWTPKEEYEDVFIKDVHGNKTLNVWYFDRKKEDCIIFYHGSSGNISNREYMVEISRVLDCNLVLVDYRGFGKSKGTPSQEGICGDGMSTYQWAIDKGEKPENIVVWGESLGGSVATYVASKRKCKSLLIMSSFSSLDDILKDKYPNHIWYSTLGGLITSVFHTLPSKNLISEVDCPVVIMHSKEDTLIPYSGALRMYNAAKEPKLLVTIKGDHSSPSMETDEIRAMISFCGLHLDNYEDEEIREIVSRIKPPSWSGESI